MAARRVRTGTAEVELAPGHAITGNATLSYALRTGDNRLESDAAAYDPLHAERRLLTSLVGLEYRSRFSAMPRSPHERRARRAEDYRFENALFAKAYTYRARSESPTSAGQVAESDAARNLLGAGDTFRAYLAPWLIAKASYELTAHLPSPEQLFGNGVLIQPNLELEPETSHNANLGPRIALERTAWGSLSVDVNGFLRETDNQILLIGTDRAFLYRNVFRARSVGVEGDVQWTSPGRWVSLQGSGTFQDLRNRSTQGAFAEYRGDRLPNRPWLFAAWGGELHFDDVCTHGDELEPFCLGRYVHSFYRSWESIGVPQFKQTVDTQVSHGIGITYGLHAGRAHLDVTFEVQNVSDARLYDSYGVQRPGRGYYAKISGDFL